MPNNWTQQSQHPKGLWSWPRNTTNPFPAFHPHSRENTLIITSTFLCPQGHQTPNSLTPCFIQTHDLVLILAYPSHSLSTTSQLWIDVGLTQPLDLPISYQTQPNCVSSQDESPTSLVRGCGGRHSVFPSPSMSPPTQPPLPLYLISSHQPQGSQSTFTMAYQWDMSRGTHRPKGYRQRKLVSTMSHQAINLDFHSLLQPHPKGPSGI